jgi:hypothetical protein
MGSLIMTKGTKLLVAHFNNEFSTYIDFYRDPTRKPLFNTTIAGYTSLFAITNQVKDLTDPNHTRRTDRKALLPNIDPGDQPGGFRHPNLQARWLWFLHGIGAGSLNPAYDKIIAQGIFTALDDSTYSNITFSCVEGAAQNATATPAYDGGTKYLQIVLTTPLMTTGSPAPGVPGIDMPNY